MDKEEMRKKIQDARDRFTFNEDLSQNEINALLTEYVKCHENKFHYDKLSWQIGAILVLASFGLMSYALTIKTEQYFNQVIYRLVSVSMAIILLISWWAIHRRYAGFAEVANERTRKIERRLGICGLGIEYEFAYFQAEELGVLEIPNTEATEVYGKEKKDDVLLLPWPEHSIVKSIVIVTTILSIIVAFIP